LVAPLQVGSGGEKRPVASGASVIRSIVTWPAPRAFAGTFMTEHSNLRRLASTATLVRTALIVPIILGLGYYYVAGALEHAATVNTFKARGDQSAYLAEAKLVYDNWHGRNDPPIIQPRNRMPLYPAYLAARYDPRWSDPEFFEHAKRHSVQLSVALLAILGIVVTRLLPALPAANLILILAFGVYVFKAGYTQSELIFYTLNFLTFIALWHLVESRTPRKMLACAILGGVLAALAHLTKAAMLPLAVVFIVVYAIDGLVRSARARRLGPAASHLAGCLLFAASFLVVLLPYLANSKRVHGQYFYNLNTSALIWYDNYPQASVAILSYGPDGWPPGRRSERPGPLKYWREHTAGQILARFENGFRDMVIASYRTFWYLKFVAIYVVSAAMLTAFAWPAVAAIVKRHAAAAAFVLSYAAVYLPAVAFYEPISGTGTTRFLLAHIPPLLFVLSMLFEAPALKERRWTVASVAIGLPHLHLALLLTIGLDLTFTLWPRLMTTYGGF
jgi:hypothetical protein